VPEEFSIPDLLSLLQIDHTHTAIQLSLEADRLCRLRQYKPAIDVAESATQLVRTDPWLLGQTLLYLSYVRLYSNLPEQVLQAKRDCDRAIRALGLSSYNYAIANMIRGQMELHIDSMSGRSNALRYFQRASEVLDKLRIEETQYNRTNRAETCTALKKQVDQQVQQLMQTMTEPAPVKVPSKQRPYQPPAPPPPPTPEKPVPLPQEAPAKIPLGEQLISQRLIWPPQEPPLVIDAPPGMTGLMPDFLGIRQLSVRNRVYDVTPLIGDDPVQLRPRQNYWVAAMEGAERGELVLVREQVRPDQAEQFVAVSAPTERRVWIDKAESTDNFTHIHILGAEREWVMRDFSPEHLDMSEPSIIGIVEAILFPADDKTA
jgi:hypothetical protein